MPREWWLKTFGFLFIVLVCFYSLLPTLLGIPDEKLADPKAPWYITMLPSNKVNLGLDLRGGVHIILGIEVDKAVEAEAEKTAVDLKEYFNSKKIPFESVTRRPGAIAVLVQPKDKDSESQIKKALRDDFYRSIEYVGMEDEKYLRYDLKPERITEIKERSVDQALRTIRNRVDEFGVAEPVIQKQSDTQILVQLPGVKDPDRAIQLLGKTALLEFKLVSAKWDRAELQRHIDEVREKVGFKDNFTKNMVDDLNKALKGVLPKDCEIAFQKEVDKATGSARITPHLLEARTLMTGDVLDDARVQTESRMNRPEVGLRFSSRGAQLFEIITGENVGRDLAILLDGVVVSAPRIQGKIPAAGAGAVITLGHGSIQKLYEEATDLALVLRAGALPAPVQIQENRTVGATLGEDSIRKGITSMAIAAVVVILFMLIYYRLMGLLADAVLVANVLFILGSLALFQATLTMPGIAGIVLTIGMAVDANVLINERIREEMRWGKSLRAAVEAGYANANLTIIDSNLTTAFAGLALYYFGTGPIKGFAVTLLIGLLWSYFTALTGTKLVVDLLLVKVRGFERYFSV